MTRQAKTTWISGVCIISPLVLFFIWELAFGSSTGTGILGIVAGFIAIKVILTVATIAFIVQGFRMHWGWGLANMFLGPLAGIAFFVKHRQEGRVPMFILAYGLILLVILLIWSSI